MKRFLLLSAVFALAPVAALAHGDHREPTPEAQAGQFVGQTEASVTLQPEPTAGDCDDGSPDCAAPTKRPSPTPRDCDDADEDCDGAAIDPTDDDSDDDTVSDDEARQTPKRDFGDRMKAGLQSIGSFFSKIASWGHNAAKSIIANLKG